MDNIRSLQLKKLFHRDSVLHDNFLFKLHHQVNFFVVLFGVLFVTGNNYLNGNSIVCLGGQDYHKQYCWIHGSGHVPNELAAQAKCSPDQGQVSDVGNDRHTHYYLWIPFVLGLCLAVIKAPRFIWKEICERGLLKGVVGEGNEHPEKMTIRLNKLRKQKAGLYFWGYFLCEILNIVCLVVCFAILNNLFDGQFFNYGSNVVNFDKEEKNAVNPMCNLFPTEVSCSVATGGIDDNADVTNILCILSNNLFNQYYFLVLWIWWVILLGLSGAGFVYRVAQIFSKDVSKIVLIYKLSPIGQGGMARKLHKYGQADYFLLGRICQNLKGSQVEEIMTELARPSTSNMKGENHISKQKEAELNLLPL